MRYFYVCNACGIKKCSISSTDSVAYLNFTCVGKMQAITSAQWHEVPQSFFLEVNSESKQMPIKHPDNIMIETKTRID